MTNAIANLTVALVEDGSLAITPYSPHVFDVSRRGGELYSGMPPGLSFLLVPTYLALKVPLALVPETALRRLDDFVGRSVATRYPEYRRVPRRSAALLLLVLGVLTVATPLALASARTLGRCAERLFPQAASGRGVLAGISAFFLLGTPWGSFSATLFHTTVGAALVWLAFGSALARDGERRPARAALLQGLALGTAAFVDYPAALYAAIAGCGIAALAPRGSRLGTGALLLAGAAPPVAATLLYHWQAFGSPWITAYQTRAIPMEHLFSVHEGIWRVIPDGPRLLRTFFSPTCSVLLFNPAVVAGLFAAGALALARPDRRRAILGLSALALICANLAHFSALPITIDPAGGSYGARYTVYSLPFALLALAPELARLRRRLGPGLWGGLLATASLPALLYFFYGSPNQPLGAYLRLLQELGPSNYALFKAYQAGWISTPYLSWAGIALLGGACWWLLRPRRQVS